MPEESVDYLQKTLDDNSTRKKYIQYKLRSPTFGFFNHSAHIIVALYRLGATRAQIDNLVSSYGERLEPRENFRAIQDDDSGKMYSRKEVEDLRGKRQLFYPILAFYEDLLRETYGNDLKRMIQGEVANVMDGLIALILHGPIHLGYGLVANNNRITCEGLAFMLHSFTPIKVHSALIDQQLGRGQKSFLDTLKDIANDPELALVPIEFDPKIIPADLVAEGDKSDEVMKYVNNIRLPSSMLEDSDEALLELANWMVDSTALLFAMSARKNNFFFLHAVTCAWGLKKVIETEGNAKNAQRYAKIFIYCVLTYYVGRGCCGLNGIATTENGEHKAEREWAEINAQAIALCDIHVAKLVQVCYDMDLEARQGKRDDADEKSTLYKAAATVAMSGKFSF